MDFSKIISLRKNQELSQRTMANLLNVSKSTYARWETGEEIIPLKHLVNLCNYFKVTMNYIFNLSSNNDFNKYDYTKKINKKEIGEKIKSIRKKENLTQYELALLFNTSQSTISAYESGKTLLLTTFAYQLSKKFNISLDSLCNLDKEVILNK